jgi:hypothetical protein
VGHNLLKLQEPADRATRTFCDIFATTVSPFKIAAIPASYAMLYADCVRKVRFLAGLGYVMKGSDNRVDSTNREIVQRPWLRKTVGLWDILYSFK